MPFIRELPASPILNLPSTPDETAEESPPGRQDLAHTAGTPDDSAANVDTALAAEPRPVPHAAAPGTVISTSQLRSVGLEELRDLCERHGPELLRGPRTAAALSKRLDDATLGPLLDQWHQRGTMRRTRFLLISDALQSQGRGGLVDNIRFDRLQRTRPDIQSPAQLSARIEDMRTGALPEDQVLGELGEALSSASTALTPEALRLFGPEPSAEDVDRRDSAAIRAWFQVMIDAMKATPPRLSVAQFASILAGSDRSWPVKTLLHEKPPMAGAHLLNQLSRVIRECPMGEEERSKLVGTSPDFWKGVEERWRAYGEALFAMHRFIGLQRLVLCADRLMDDPCEICALLINGSVTTNRVADKGSQVSRDPQTRTTSPPWDSTRVLTPTQTHDGLASPLEALSALRAVGEYPWRHPSRGREVLRSILACGGSADQPLLLMQYAYNQVPTGLFIGFIAETLLACKALGSSPGEAGALLQVNVDQPYAPESALNLNEIQQALLALPPNGKLPEDMHRWFGNIPD